LTQLRHNAVELLAKYTPQNTLVKNNQAQIDELESQRRTLERKFPSLVATTPSSTPGNDLATERGRLAGLEAKTKWLQNRLNIVKEGTKQFTDTAAKMAQLERQKGVEEKNYTYFGERLEKARVDEALDPKQMPNISAVQAPTPAIRVTKERDKLALGFAGGGLALGFALAGLVELVIDRSVKRPLELETKLRIPLLLSIPYVGRSARRRLGNGGNAKGKELAVKSNGHPNTAPWEGDHFIRTYSEAIRDRLDLFFKINDLRHKPKLIGVTGFSEGAGTSTLAGGLASALSELGDGKVLLVDMNAASAQVHPFFEGRPASSLSAALQPANPIASAAENLYLATASGNDGPAQLGLKKFYDLMPTLKASDFDYIVFDMPPLGQTSPTLSMARFMDKLLLIVEAEKSNRDAVKRAYAKLVASRANVSGILNKTRTYGPAALAGEA
jgi:Mrp family chromosome partitioning ATPase